MSSNTSASSARNIGREPTRADVLAEARADHDPKKRAMVQAVVDNRSAESLMAFRALEDSKPEQITEMLCDCAAGMATVSADKKPGEFDISAPTVLPENTYLSSAAVQNGIRSAITLTLDGKISTEEEKKLKMRLETMCTDANEDMAASTAYSGKKLRVSVMESERGYKPEAGQATTHFAVTVTKDKGKSIAKVLDSLDPGFKNKLQLPTEDDVATWAADWMARATGWMSDTGTITTDADSLKLKDDSTVAAVYETLLEKCKVQIRAMLTSTLSAHCRHITDCQEKTIPGLTLMSSDSAIHRAYSREVQKPNSRGVYLVELHYYKPWRKANDMMDYVFRFAVMLACGVTESQLSLSEMPEAVKQAGAKLRQDGGCIVMTTHMDNAVAAWFNLIRDALQLDRQDVVALLTLTSATDVANALLHVFDDKMMSYDDCINFFAASVPTEIAPAAAEDDIATALEVANQAQEALTSTKAGDTAAIEAVEGFLKDLHMEMVAAASNIRTAVTATIDCVAARLKLESAKRKAHKAATDKESLEEVDEIASAEKAIEETKAEVVRLTRVLRAKPAPTMVNWNYETTSEDWSSKWEAARADWQIGDALATLKKVIGKKVMNKEVPPKAIEDGDEDWQSLKDSLDLARMNTITMVADLAELEVTVMRDMRAWAKTRAAAAQQQADSANAELKRLRDAAESLDVKRKLLTFRGDVYARLLLKMAQQLGVTDKADWGSVFDAVMAVAVARPLGKALSFQQCIGIDAEMHKYFSKVLSRADAHKEAQRKNIAMAAKSERAAKPKAAAEQRGVEGTKSKDEMQTADASASETAEKSELARYLSHVHNTPPGAGVLMKASENPSTPAYRGYTMKAAAGEDGRLSGRQRGYIDIVVDGVEATRKRLMQTASALSKEQWKKLANHTHGQTSDMTTDQVRMYQSPMMPEIRKELGFSEVKSNTRR